MCFWEDSSLFWNFPCTGTMDDNIRFHDRTKCSDVDKDCFRLPQASLDAEEFKADKRYIKKHKNIQKIHKKCPRTEANKSISMCLSFRLSVPRSLLLNFFIWLISVWISFVLFTYKNKPMNKERMDKNKIPELLKWSTCHPVGVTEAWNCLTFFFSPYAWHHQLFPLQLFFYSEEISGSDLARVFVKMEGTWTPHKYTEKVQKGLSVPRAFYVACRKNSLSSGGLFSFLRVYVLCLFFSFIWWLLYSERLTLSSQTCHVFALVSPHPSISFQEELFHFSPTSSSWWVTAGVLRQVTERLAGKG